MKKIVTMLLTVFALSVGFSSVGMAEELNQPGNEGETISPEEQVIDISGYSLVLEQSEFVHTGEEICPSVTVIYTENEEEKVLAEENYEIIYENNIGVGNASVKIVGKNNYTGELLASFKIKAFGTVESSVTTTPSNKKIKITWKKISQADGYYVYRRTANGTSKRIAKVTSGRTYTDTSVKMGTTYYYKVCAYRTIDGKVYRSSYTTEKKQRAQVAKVTGVKASASTYNSIKISFSKVSGAEKYGIYRSTSKNGTYTRIGTVKSGSTLSFKDTKRTCGRTYYYKVAAYKKVNGSYQYGAKSDAVSARTKPSKTKFTTTKPYNTKVTLKWKKSSGAKGYEIYRSNSKSSGYKLVKTITGGSTLSWTNTGLKKNTAYYYKIRAYTVVNGKKVYSSYSSVYKRSISGWRYVNGYKLYYNSKGEVVQDVRSIIGKQSSYVIKVNKQRCVVTVYAKDGANGYIIPVVAFICSPGEGTPTGTFYTPAKYRWHELYKQVYGQWNTRITGHILFHSVYYTSYNNNNSLGVPAYNKLGSKDSMGCIRLTAGDAKWIYDNCKLGTKVTIYNSASVGPLKKPSAYKLPYWHTWDPTDPNKKSKCKSNGCH